MHDVSNTPPQLPLDRKAQLRRKNWVMLTLLLALMVALYGLSFIKFGQAVYG